MIDRDKTIRGLKELCEYLFHEYKVCYHGDAEDTYNRFLIADNALNLLEDQPKVVRCKDCKHWDKTTREEGNDCILGPWEDAVCDVFQDWDSYGDLGENFRRTNGDWFCADGKRR